MTQIIALLRPRALIWKQTHARGRWAIEFPANDGVVFCLVGRGRCLFQAPDVARTLNPGDLLLMSAPPRWTLGDSAATHPVPREDLPAAADGRVVQIGDGDPSEPATAVFGGYFAIDRSNATLLEGLLPGRMILPAGEAGALRLRAILTLIGDEVGADRPGQAHVLERLLELMLVEAIRHVATNGGWTNGGIGPAQDRKGLLSGLADPRLGPALRALHADIAHGWSVASLAAAAGMSRSAFSARFGEVVGLAPMDYLLRWRMAVAKDALKAGNRRLQEIAEASGYSSASAFSVAFSRIVGCAPSRYA